MPMLRDPKLERFAQELASGLNEGLSARAAATKAGTAAGYPAGSSFAANCHKRAQRADVKARVDELRAPGVRKAEEQIAITTEYLLAKLDSLSSFNIDDYLTSPDNEGRRYLDVSAVPKHLLGRLSEVSQDVSVITPKRGKRKVTLARTKLKGYDPIAALRLMAQIKGLLSAEKHEHSGPDGGPILTGPVSDKDRARALAAFVAKTQAQAA